MLLIVEALLLSAALAQVVGLKLDMALDSVDDYYLDCTKDMAKEVERKYLIKESKNSDFGKAWLVGEKNALNNNLKRNNSIAIYVYTNTDFKIYQTFNNDTRHGKHNYTAMKYTWYSLQFLLTEAIQTLKETQNRCFNTFRGTKLIYEIDMTSSIIRLGSFTSSSLDRNIAKRFGNTSCFEIHTCLGANVTQYSRLAYENEVLIPPYETFNITAVKTRKDQKDLWCETVITLRSFGMKSELNCALFNKPRP